MTVNVDLNPPNMGANIEKPRKQVLKDQVPHGATLEFGFHGSGEVKIQGKSML